MRRLLPAALITLLLLLPLRAGSALAQDGPSSPPPTGAGAPSVTLSPTRAEGVVDAGQLVGPFGLRNGTGQAYGVRVIPVLLAQRRDGGLGLRDDAAGLTQAGRLLRVRGGRFTLEPGADRALPGEVRRPSRTGGLYAGLLFRAVPREKRRRPDTGPRTPQIENALELTASVFLDPPPDKRRVRLAAAGPIRAEQAGEGRLRLLAPVLNRGNAYEPVRGRVRIRSTRGRRSVPARLRGLKVLPDATVDLAAEPTARLEPGDYEIAGDLEAGGRRFRSRGRMRLVGVNEIEARAARLASLANPEAIRGEQVEVKAGFLNTGNVPYAPTAEVEARSQAGGVSGPVAARVPLSADGPARPGQEGALAGRLALPRGGPSYELTVKLLEDGRVLDSRSVSVTPSERPSLAQRARDLVAAQAVPILLGALALTLIGAAVATLYIRRLKRVGHNGIEPPSEKPPEKV